MKKPRIYAGVTPHDLNRNKPPAKLSCSDCEATTDKLFLDRADPPLEEGPCLCLGCAKDHIDTRIDDLESEIKALEAVKAKLT